MAHYGTFTESPTDWSLSLEVPGVRSFKSVFSNANQVISSGAAYWSGVVTYGPVSAVKTDDIAEIEAMLVFLGGGEHTVNLPIPGISQKNRFSAAVTVTAVSVDGVHASLTVSQAGTVKKSDWLQIGNRLYKAIEDQAGTVISVTPGDIPAALPTALDWETPEIRVRQRPGQTILMRRNVDFAGPYSFQFTEAV